MPSKNHRVTITCTRLNSKTPWKVKVSAKAESNQTKSCSYGRMDTLLKPGPIARLANALIKQCDDHLIERGDLPCHP